MLNVSAIILSGGRATRLNGEDKGLVLFQDKPLISYVLESLSAQLDDIVISANRHIEEYEKFGYSVVSDGNQGYLGPLVGVFSGLALCRHDKVFVTSCDMPFLPENLLTFFDVNSSKEMQVIAVNNRIQLCFLMDKSLLSSLEIYLKNGENRVVQWIKSCSFEVVNYENEEHFKNFNHLSDFENH